MSNLVELKREEIISIGGAIRRSSRSKPKEPITEKGFMETAYEYTFKPAAELYEWAINHESNTLIASVFGATIGATAMLFANQDVLSFLRKAHAVTAPKNKPE